MSRTIINQRHLFMNRTLEDNTDSFIIIKSSSFINLNAYTEVISLAEITPGKTFKNNFKEEDILTLDTIFHPIFVNKGIVLNVEDFGGRIEIFDSIFDRNFHYIPGILYNGDSKGNEQINTFIDKKHDELHFTVCKDGKDTHFFGSSQIMTMMGAEQNSETDSLFN